MRTLISQYSQPHFSFKFPSFSLEKGKPIFFLQRKWILNISGSLRASCTANSAASYNGWDDLRIWVDTDELGESNQLKSFLISLGIDDKKYLFTCILGFVCALAISRVRVSSIIVFPAAAIVFAIGFSFGFANGKPHKGLSLNGSKRRGKGDSLRVYVEKLRSLEEIFDGFDFKVGQLKNDIKKAIDYERVELGDLGSYLNAVESIGELVLNVRNVVEDCVGGTSGEEQEVEKNSYQKNSKKKKENGNKGFDLFGFIGSFVRDNATDSKSSRTTSVKREIMAKDVMNQVRPDLRGSAVERASDVVSSIDASIPDRATSRNGSRSNKLGDREQEIQRILQSRRMSTMDSYVNAKTFLNADGYNYQNIRFMDDQRFSLNMSTHREIREWTSDDSMNSNSEFDVTKENQENEASLKNQQILWNSNGAYESSGNRDNINNGSYGASFKQERMNLEDELLSGKYQSELESDMGYFSSSKVSDDVLFDKCLRKANNLLKQAKECFKVRNNEMLADKMLHESAKLLSQAIAMKPMSLLAIGQLGNTYLLHGELKLRISREFRSLLSKSDDLGVERWSNLLAPEYETLPSKDRLATLLVNACEECEGLLVEAGRKYRMSLAIDGNDLKALYNWGLALSFRAQLLADIGPEAALDADKLFLAAIDKFDAMMSRSNVYAPEALFRWGVALQQRSRLRPSNNRDKVKLLQQAKRLYEDALNMGSGNLQVKRALSSCISELDFSDI